MSTDDEPSNCLGIFTSKALAESFKELEEATYLGLKNIQVPFIAEGQPHPMWMVEQLVQARMAIAGLGMQNSLLKGLLKGVLAVLPEFELEEIETQTIAHLKRKVAEATKKVEEVQKASMRPNIILPGNNGAG